MRPEEEGVPSRKKRFLSLNLAGLMVLASALCSPSLRAEPVDREVAEWALRMGGTVVLGDSSQRINDVNELPAGDFRLKVLY
ncbi:MAG: hypothetical protein L0Z50_35040, partial [Verrucomicrobiales bacterium]|nr:hypothetical protein [Verrucomicrobiales bacterium]